MKPYIFIGLFVIVLIAVVFFIQNTGPQCTIDSDCTPATCYHADQCVSKLDAPNCTGIYGTQECVSNTLDCGQGSCACEKGICKANIKK